jgi:hypothetical protein
MSSVKSDSAWGLILLLRGASQNQSQNRTHAAPCSFAQLCIFVVSNEAILCWPCVDNWHTSFP